MNVPEAQARPPGGTEADFSHHHPLIHQHPKTNIHPRPPAIRSGRQLQEDGSTNGNPGLSNSSRATNQQAGTRGRKAREGKKPANNCSSGLPRREQK